MIEKTYKFLKVSKIVAQVILFLVSMFWFVFALLSGAGDYGGGLKGILKNSMIALPWLILLGFNYLVYRLELSRHILRPVSIIGVILVLLSIPAAFIMNTGTASDFRDISSVHYFFILFAVAYYHRQSLDQSI